MATVLTRPEAPPGGGVGAPLGRNGGDHRPSPPPNTARIGMLLALASVSMLFIAFTSAYIFRLGIVGDWTRLAMPPILPMNTALLFASSVTLELSRRALAGHATVYRFWLAGTLLLGMCFLGGQILAWQWLVGQGVLLTSGPHIAFFYTLTAAHALHVAGGLCALGILVYRARRAPSGSTMFTRRFGVTSMYWHFMGVLWVYLLLLLFVWR